MTNLHCAFLEAYPPFLRTTDLEGRVAATIRDHRGWIAQVDSLIVEGHPALGDEVSYLRRRLAEVTAELQRARASAPLPSLATQPSL